jgi:prolipoprotein diacylglyceryltransferase
LNRGIVWNIASLEIAGLLFITGLLFLLSKTKKLATGQLFYSFCLSYFVLRIGLETLKYIGEGISVVSYISLTGVTLSAWKGFQLKKSMTKSDKPKQT